MDKLRMAEPPQPEDDFWDPVIPKQDTLVPAITHLDLVAKARNCSRRRNGKGRSKLLWSSELRNSRSTLRNSSSKTENIEVIEQAEALGKADQPAQPINGLSMAIADEDRFSDAMEDESVAQARISPAPTEVPLSPDSAPGGIFTNFLDTTEGHKAFVESKLEHAPGKWNAAAARAAPHAFYTAFQADAKDGRRVRLKVKSLIQTRNWDMTREQVTRKREAGASKPLTTRQMTASKLQYELQELFINFGAVLEKARALGGNQLIKHIAEDLVPTGIKQIQTLFVDRKCSDCLNTTSLPSTAEDRRDVIGARAHNGSRFTPEVSRAMEEYRAEQVLYKAPLQTRGWDTLDPYAQGQEPEHRERLDSLSQGERSRCLASISNYAEDSSFPAAKKRPSSLPAREVDMTKEQLTFLVKSRRATLRRASELIIDRFHRRNLGLWRTFGGD